MLERLLKSAFLAVLFSYLYLFFFYPVETGDIWWHLASGRWFLRHSTIPQQDVFSFTTTQQPWIPVQWLGSLIFYRVYSLFGLGGLQAFRSLFFGILCLIFYRYSQRKMPVHFSLVLTLLLAHSLTPRCLLRPLMFNFLFVQIFLIQLFAYQDDGQIKRLIGLLLCGIIWANIHLGAFFYGYAIIGSFLLGALMEYFGNLKKEHQSDIRPVLHLTIFCVFYFLVFFINPHGFHNSLYPVKVFFDNKFIRIYDFLYLFSEVGSTRVFLTSIHSVPFILLFIFALISLIKAKRHHPTLIILFLGSLYIFSKGIRGCAYFGIICCYLAAASNSYADRQIPKRYKQVFLGIIILFLMLQISGKMMEQDYSGDHLVPKLSIQTEINNPQSCVDFLLSQNFQGKIYNHDNLGGYILFRGYPQLKPFTDGRMLELDRQKFQEYVGVNNDPADHWGNLDKKYRFDAVLLDSTKPQTDAFMEVLARSSDWRKTMENRSCVLYLKKRTKWRNFLKIMDTPDDQ